MSTLFFSFKATHSSRNRYAYKFQRGISRALRGKITAAGASLALFAGTAVFSAEPPDSTDKPDFAVSDFSASAATTDQASRHSHTPAPIADEPVLLENMVVTATPFSRDQAELASATSVLSGQNLLFNESSSLGATLDTQPGITSTYFGPGASRPVIRGLGGDRLRILENSTGTIDASTISPDHAVALEPLLARRIEVVRGPATLLYGSNAVGGVVNVINNSIPETAPDLFVTGRFEGRFGTNANERAGIASLDGALARTNIGTLAWHIDGVRRKTDDVRIPGFANPSDPVDRGTLPNSAIDTTAYGAGLSLVGESGFAGLSGKRYETTYGTVAESDVTIHLIEKRLDLAAELARAFSIFSGARAKFGISDYTHTEFEGDEPGTTFNNKGYEGRLELLHEKLAGVLSGSWGAQFMRGNFSALGDEALMPPAITQNQALFAFEEMPLSSLTIQFGARGEHQHISSESNGGVTRDDNLLSMSAGLVVPLEKTKTWALTLSLARTERAPNAQELFSNGPHVGTDAYEIGNPSLANEISHSIDIGLRKKRGHITGTLSVFVNQFDNFIYEQKTGAIKDFLPVYQYTSDKALFYGAELETVFHLYEAKAHTLDLTFAADIVRAQNQTLDAPLPHITPARARLELQYKGPRFSASLAMQTVDRAHNLAPGETPTAGYGLLGANAAWRVKFGDHTECEFFARASNLLDQEARNNVSFLKDIAPLPGRDITLGVRITF